MDLPSTSSPKSSLSRVYLYLHRVSGAPKIATLRPRIHPCTGSPLRQSLYCDLERTPVQGLRCAILALDHLQGLRCASCRTAALNAPLRWSRLCHTLLQTRTQLNPAPPVLRLVRGSARGNGVLARIAGGNGVLTFPGLFIDATATPNYDRYSPMPNHLELMGTYT